MMNNQYANYVVQHILSVVDGGQRDVCVDLISPHVGSLKGSKYGQRVAMLVERMKRKIQPSLRISLSLNDHIVQSLNNLQLK